MSVKVFVCLVRMAFISSIRLVQVVHKLLVAFIATTVLSVFIVKKDFI